MSSQDTQRQVANLLLDCGCGTVSPRGMRVNGRWLAGPPAGTFRRLGIVDVGPNNEPIFGDVVFDVGPQFVTVWNCRTQVPGNSNRRIGLDRAQRALSGSNYALTALEALAS